MLPIQDVKAFYDALAKGEIQAVLALLDPDVHLDAGGSSAQHG